MNVEQIAHMRQQAEDALNRARVLPPSDAKRQWEAIANAWRELLAFLGDGPAPPTEPGIDIGNRKK
jgi:hypothetical protein